MIFPEASEKWLQTLIKEVEAGAGYTGKVKSLAKFLSFSLSEDAAGTAEQPGVSLHKCSVSTADAGS